MPRFVILLRGVNPLNAKMPELKRCFEAAGFSNVKTLLGSGNVIVDDTARSESSVERKAEKAMQVALGRVFYPIARSSAYLQALVEADPFVAHRAPAEAKRVVTFMRKPPKGKVELPRPEDGVSILCVEGREILTAYLPSPKGPVFMRQIERTFGTDVTTRTWDTVRKCATA
jgi:uncharacterized protein (DUF1697 family)